jgi:hypothetical protein
VRAGRIAPFILHTATPLLVLGVGGYALGGWWGAAAFCAVWAVIVGMSVFLSRRQLVQSQHPAPRPDVPREARLSWQIPIAFSIGTVALTLILEAAGVPFAWTLLIVLLVGMPTMMVFGHRTASRMRGATRDDRNLMFDLEINRRVWMVIGLGVAVGFPLILVAVVLLNR